MPCSATSWPTAKAGQLLVPQVAWGHFAANAEGDDLVIFEGRDPELGVDAVHLPPPDRGSPGCASATSSGRLDSGEPDWASFQLVTMGSRVSEEAARLFADNQYQRYLYLHGLGVEMAEALAEYWHRRIREELGFAERGRAHPDRPVPPEVPRRPVLVGLPGLPRPRGQRQGGRAARRRPHRGRGQRGLPAPSRAVDHGHHLPPSAGQVLRRLTSGVASCSGSRRALTGYTFGDDERATRRLELVADAYRSSSQAFIRRHARRGADMVVDLGCGPGFSTELLYDTLRPGALIGIDASASYVDRARHRLPTAEFVVHDASATPLPGSPADVLYARLLLAHLPDPAGTAVRWRGELQPDGVLLIEDLEDIDSPPGPLRDYDEIAAAIVRSGGGPMYAGRLLAGLGGSCVEVGVPMRVAAAIYLFNVDRWLAEPPGGLGGRPAVGTARPPPRPCHACRR